MSLAVAVATGSLEYAAKILGASQHRKAAMYTPFVGLQQTGATQICLHIRMWLFSMLQGLALGVALMVSSLLVYELVAYFV